KKPFSAVSVQVDRLTGEQYEENDVGGIVDLIEVIRIQASGPTEAARALRKKLYVYSSKYGNVHRQIRALVILDALIQNAGSRFQKAFADEPLLERLRILARDDMVDAEVRQKVNVLFRQWAVAYKATPGLEHIAALHKELPRTKRPQPQQSRIVRQQDAEAAREREEQSPPSTPQYNRRPEPSSTPSSSSRPVALGHTSQHSSIFKRDKKDKKSSKKAFNLDKEKGQVLETIASANVSSTNLLNGLQLINREQQRVSENPEVMRRFESCKQLRRQILRYIHLVESEQFIGPLLNANDELVKALMAFEVMDKSIDDDSDSDDESGSTSTAQAAMSRMKVEDTPPTKPPRPMSIPMPAAPALGKHRAEPEDEAEEDEDDPFSDNNVVKTPWNERGPPTWRDV
ncbi:hypothetical protein P153DRAFT_303236, partial [Dothidotthia symphoricarpi CBS 119687]